MCTKFVSAFTSAIAGTVLLACGSLAAHALPAAAFAASHEGGGITLVADDCGIGRHRGPEGFCRRNEERIVVAPGAVVVEPRAIVVEPRVVEPGRLCPLGMHWGPYRRECVLN